MAESLPMVDGEHEDSAGGFRFALPTLPAGAEGLAPAGAVTVQQDAAGVWGVPRFPLSPQDWGAGG
jgi:hypothetical protein